ncbi:MAG: hypothetical protein JKY45_04750 [Emcibacter sp.]|nr:hypothetical protein [Emcibacter sp.]
MIFEAIQHILTPARKEVKALGYVREAIAIEERYGRCRKAWADHLDQCQQKILVTAGGIAPGSTIMIIGSGALHDVPMAALLALGHSLVLVDIIHLPKIRKLYQKNTAVRFITQDVTGLVGPLFYDKAATAVIDSLPSVDLVVSLNILSQLPLNLISYAQKYKISLPDDFAAEVMRAHVSRLRSLAPQALIIGDMARSYHQGVEILDRESALPEIGLPAPSDLWDWNIAPVGELDRNIALIHHVACWQIRPEA